MSGNIILVILIVVGLVGRSNIITTAACILLVVKLLSLDRYLPTIERRGLELGLTFLTMGVLVPFASGRISGKAILSALATPTGIAALCGGAIAAYMNGRGLNMLKIDPQIIVGLVIGSITGVIFLKGVPVGPLMAAGLTALLIKTATFIINLFK